MDSNSFRLFSGSAGAGSIPAIGSFYQGGYFAGLISQTANGVATHGLIVAPKSTEVTAYQWKTSDTSSPGTTSVFDGALNTLSISDASHPAGSYCANLSINGYSDWYLPARYELDIAYFNLKPTTSVNNTNWGINDYSVPKRTVNYTSSDPAQTTVSIFQSTGTEPFNGLRYWSSTEASSTNAWLLSFSNGLQDNFAKTSSFGTFVVRAFRKFSV